VWMASRWVRCCPYSAGGMCTGSSAAAGVRVDGFPVGAVLSREAPCASGAAAGVRVDGFPVPVGAVLSMYRQQVHREQRRAYAWMASRWVRCCLERLHVHQEQRQTRRAVPALSLWMVWHCLRGAYDLMGIGRPSLSACMLGDCAAYPPCMALWRKGCRPIQEASCACQSCRIAGR